MTLISWRKFLLEAFLCPVPSSSLLILTGSLAISLSWPGYVERTQKKSSPIRHHLVRCAWHLSPWFPKGASAGSHNSARALLPLFRSARHKVRNDKCFVRICKSKWAALGLLSAPAPSRWKLQHLTFVVARKSAHPFLRRGRSVRLLQTCYWSFKHGHVLPTLIAALYRLCGCEVSILVICFQHFFRGPNLEAAFLKTYNFGEVLVRMQRGASGCDVTSCRVVFLSIFRCLVSML